MSSRNLSVCAAVLAASVLVSTQLMAESSPRNQLRQAYFQECQDRFSGMQRAFGICMHGKAKLIRQLSEQSRENFRECLEEQKDRIVCDLERDEFWLSRIPDRSGD